MIFFEQNDDYAKSYPIDICMKFANKFIDENMEFGKYELEDGIYCSASSAVPPKSEEVFFEAHRRYADLHFIIEGQQRMWVGCINQMQILDYVEEKDFVKVVGNHQVELLQISGTSTVVFPNDAHTLAPEYASDEVVKKIIFKIPLTLFGHGE